MQQATALGAGTHTRTGAYILLTTLVFIWGVNWPIMKISMQFLPPLWFVVSRLLLGSLSLFVLLPALGLLALPSRRDVVQLLTGGILQLPVYMGFIILGLRHVGAGRGAVLAYTTPLWVVPGAIIFLKEKLDRLKLAGLGFGLAGMLVLFNPFAIDWSNPAVIRDNGLLVLSAAAWSAAILITRGRPWHLTPLQLAPWQMLLGGTLLIPFAEASETFPHLQPGWELAAILVYNGPITIGFGFWASVTVARALPAITSSLSFLAVPAFGIISSVVWLGEPVGISLIAGFGLILVGVALVAAADRRS
jgi:drug/metabolite transporter (DMT)-like permease